MLEPSYRRAITEAWKLVWHNKIIWIFGLLSALLGGLGINNYLGRLLLLFGGEAPYGFWRWSRPFWLLPGHNPQSAALAVWFLTIILAVASLAAVASAVSQGALIAAAAAWFRRRGALNVATAWQRGSRHWARVLIINIGERILLGGLAILVWFLAAPFVVITGAIGLAGQIIVVTLGLLAGLAVTSTAIFALGYAVEADATVSEAVGAGWRLFRGHMLVALELSLVFLLFSLLLLVIIVSGSILVLAPSFLLAVAGGASGQLALVAWGVALSSFLFVLLIVLLASIYNAFATSAWMYLFMKMHHEGLASRMLHWLGRILRK